nr:T9SS type A sorting domain-containing protein [Hymenobacter sp. ISL-91]
MTGIPEGYRISGANATGGTLNRAPVISNGRAEYEVTWGNGEAGNITAGLQRPDGTSWINVTVPTAPSVTIKSVFGRNITDRINGVTEINLPLCGGAETLTLTLPEHYFNSNTSFPITSYLWGVPPSFTVVGGQPATVFGPNNWLSGRTITIQVPAGQFDELVAVKLWSRECEGPGLNAPATQTSNPQYVRIRRTLPTITGIVASRTTLTCGDQRPLTLTAATSQPGANSFAWSLPAGWNFAPGSATNAASVSVVPSGSGGGTASATATYNCVGYTTPAGNANIGWNPQVATPTAFTAPVIGSSNTFGVCASEQPLFRFAAVAGATGYRWEFPAGFAVVGNPAATSPYVTAVPELQLQAPATFAATEGILQVRAINANCQPSNPLFVQLLTGSGEGGISSSDYTPAGGTVCPYTSLMLRAITEATRGQNTNFQWTVSGGAQIAAGATSSVLELQMPESGYVYVQVQFQNECDGLKTASWYVNVDQTYINGRPVCSPQSRMASIQPIAYPNPADGALTLEQPAGTVLTIRNSQGKAVYQGRAGQQPTRLDTRAWPAGLYFLHSRQGQQTERRQLQIKH